MLLGADKIIQKIKEEGDTIHFITAKLININECDIEAITRINLKNENILYNSLITLTSSRNVFYIRG